MSAMTYQGNEPTKEAAAVANAPYHNVPMPYALMRSFKIVTPGLPCVCMVVCAETGRDGVSLARTRAMRSSHFERVDWYKNHAK